MMRTPRLGTTFVWACFVGLFLFAGQCPVGAADYYWNAPGGGYFWYTPNWNPVGKPSVGDAAIFDLAGTYTVTFELDEFSTEGIRVEDGNVTFDLGAFEPHEYIFGYAFTILPPPSVVGTSSGKSARLTLINGTVSRQSFDDQLATGLIVGNIAPGSNNEADEMVVGANAVLNLAAGELHVGPSGQGSFIVQQGGVVSASRVEMGSGFSGTGITTVTGAGSTLTGSDEMNIGVSGNGHLSVTSGGLVQITGSAGTNVGVDGFFDNVGTMVVSGAGSTFTSTAALTIGNEGTGEMTISGGGTVTTLNGTLASSATGQGTVSVTGPGSTWNMTFNAFVGAGGTGTMTVANGGHVDVGLLTAIGTNDGTGDLIVTGAGSMLTSPGIEVGLSGTGTMTIADGATVSTTILSSVGGLAGNTGAVTVTGPGSTWTSEGNLLIGAANSGDATLTVGAGGTLDVMGTLTLNDPADAAVGKLVLEKNGTVMLANGIVRRGVCDCGAGILIISGGTLDNGETPTPLTVSGTTAVDPATLRLTGTATTSNISTFTVGSTNRGVVEVFDDADLTTDAGRIGNSAGSLGSLTVQGSGATWTANGDLTVGVSGTGTLAVSTGGIVTANMRTLVGNESTGIGTLNVTGAASRFSSLGAETVIGDAGTGTVNVTSGGQVTTTAAILGSFATGSGALNVTGAGSRFLNVGAELIGGGAGEGTVNVTIGGKVTTSTATLGSSVIGTGAVRVSGAGSVFQAANLNVGGAGSGDVLVSDRGRLEARGGLSTVGGSVATATGTVTIMGAGSSGDVDALLIGSPDSGPATVNVLDGASLLVREFLVLEAPASGFSVLAIDGGSVTVRGTFTRRGLFNILAFDDGTLTMDGGHLDNSETPTPLDLNGATENDHSTLRMVGYSTMSNVSNLTVGLDHVGSIYVEAGSTVTAENLYIGADAGARGEVTLDGPDARVETSADVSVGGTLSAGGRGTLNVGRLSVVSASGTLNLFGLGTINLDGGRMDVAAFNPAGGIFNFNSGTVNFTSSTNLTAAMRDTLLGPTRTVSFGRQLSSASNLTLAADLIIDGGSVQVDGDLTNVGNVFLQLRSGTASADASVLNLAGGVISLEGGALSATHVINSGEVHLRGGTSRITATDVINNGIVTGSGQVAAKLLNLSNGEVRTMFGERLVFTSTADGQVNNGLVDVQGGTVEFTGALVNNSMSPSTGQIASGGGTLRFRGGLTNAGSLTLATGVGNVHGNINNVALAPTTGRIIVTGGGTANFYGDIANSGAIQVSAAGALASTAVFFGALSGNGIAGGGNVFLEGDVRPGFSPGVMRFGGDTTFGPNSTLHLELGGATPGSDYDQIQVAGHATLDGTLAIEFIDGFVPAAGQTFTLFTADTRSGSFNAVSIVNSFPGLTWTISQTGELTITTSALAGDINLDGLVNSLDAAAFVPFLGNTTGSLWATGDFDFDGATTALDLSLLQSNLGRSVSSPAAVPEPAAWMLILGAVAILVGRRADVRFTRGRSVRS